MKLRTKGCLLAGGMACASGAMAGEIAADLAERVKRTAPDERIRVIITLNDQLDVESYRGRRRGVLISDLRRHADLTQASLRAAIAGEGAADVTPLWIINSIAAEVPVRLIKSLSRRPDVARVRLDDEAVLPPTQTSQAPPTWNLAAIRTDALWAEGLAGAGAVVASLDTGADVNHPDLNGRWRGGHNSWYDPYRQHAAPHDAHGHGTQTLGIMVGGDASGIAIGIAPQAQWIAARIFNDAHIAYTSAIHRAFQWVLDPDGNPATDDAPQVVVGAWGLLNTNACVPEFEQDVQVLKAANIAVAFSAGNTGPFASTSLSPANYADSYAIGAVGEDLAVAEFSARGPSACTGGLYPHVVAPGVNIRTADLSFGGVAPNPYITVSGTSFSAAHLGGAIALLRAAVANADVAAIESALNESAADLGQPGADNAYGHGLIDVAAAYQRLIAAVPPPEEEEPPAEEPPPDEPPPDADADADGYSVAAGDCNDADASIQPGATEVKYDGIDQDCNGYDLTIDITRALYTARRGTLEVIATSQYGAQAALSLHGIGAMNWNAVTQTWQRVLKPASPPASVTVTGPEGQESTAVILR